MGMLEVAAVAAAAGVGGHDDGGIGELGVEFELRSRVKWGNDAILGGTREDGEGWPVRWPLPPLAPSPHSAPHR
jgi:hypothetical protein